LYAIKAWTWMNINMNMSRKINTGMNTRMSMN
jgi:hypothetical protein